MKKRYIHLESGKWSWRIPKSGRFVEIRSPEGKKTLVHICDIDRSEEFDATHRIVDYYAYDPSISDDEFHIYENISNNKEVILERDKEIKNYFFGIQPSMVKDFIENKLNNYKTTSDIE